MRAIILTGETEMKQPTKTCGLRMDGTRIESGCGRVLSVDNFYAKAYGRYENICKECRRKQMRNAKAVRNEKKQMQSTAEQIQRAIEREATTIHGKEWLRVNHFFRTLPTECDRKYCEVGR